MEVSYEVVLRHLQYSEYPEGSTNSRKRAVRNKSKKFLLKDGILFNSNRQWITDGNRQHQIIEACHADKLGGHLGRDKTRDKVSSRFVLVLL